MGFFDIFKRSTQEKLLVPAEKKSYLATLENPASLFTLDNTFEGRGKQGYLSNPYVFACIDQRAANLASLPICLKINDEKVYDHEILNMFIDYLLFLISQAMLISGEITQQIQASLFYTIHQMFLLIPVLERLFTRLAKQK